MIMISIITHSEKGKALVDKLLQKDVEAELVTTPVNYEKLWETGNALVFIGALGICVREIAPFLKNKKTDPAVINIDVAGRFVQPVVSGHVGGANELARKLAGLIGAVPVITTVSDTSGLWPLDVLPRRFDWKMECSGNLTRLTGLFVNGAKTALLLEARDNGTLFLETGAPDFVDIYYSAKELDVEKYDLILAVTPFRYDFGKKAVFYRPAMICLGLGCQRGLPPEDFLRSLEEKMKQNSISPLSVASLATVELKKDEEAFLFLSRQWQVPLVDLPGEILAGYEVPSPSEKVKRITGSGSVAEAAAMHQAQNSLLVPKTKMKAGDRYFTYAVAIDRQKERKGMVDFVGAGPGDPELISLRGKHLLQTADYILYAGSLVPEELTHDAKPGCVVESSAGMDLQTQLQSMKHFYDRDLSIVRLHTGDPCLYGAIQEQMAVMDEWGWNYRVTPGISSFQAAAAALRSEFTIPEEVQTVILTRGEGRTPVPEKEQLHKLAASQSTMCIYLSASIAEKVEQELLTHYPPETPVAVCYKLTWKEEKIYRCTLQTLAQTIRENQLSMTTLIVVGKAIGNRSGESRLYDKHFTHAFRKTKPEKK